MLLTARAYGASESAALPASVSQASSTAAATAPSQWWLSAGVFRTDGAAEVRRAALIEHGVAAARVVEAQLAGAVVHRVVVGPFADRAQARSQLSAVRAW